MISALRQFLVKCGYAASARGWRPPSWIADLVTDFFDRTYLLGTLRQFDINFVVDVGASTGSFARNMRRLGYSGPLVSFEPNPESFYQLCRAMRMDSRWWGVNIALGQEDATAPFRVTEVPDLSSLLVPFSGHVEKTIPVDVRRLDAVLPSFLHEVPSPRLFLKIDTQGFDVEVVKGATETLRHVMLLQSEVSVDPIYEGMPHYLEALSFYESLGFTLMTLFPVARKRPYRNIIEYDCLMARLGPTNQARPARVRTSDGTQCV
jgi:FkbM family methyltransferase